jgi:hypothetical protein
MASAGDGGGEEGRRKKSGREGKWIMTERESGRGSEEEE